MKTANNISMKAIKGILLTLAFVGMFSSKSNAQKEDWGSDSLECRKCVSLYAEPLRQKNYEEAAFHWRCIIQICPKLKESIYINGAIIYRNLIDKETDAVKKEKFIDTLIWVYDKQMEYFGRKTEVLERYGNDLLKYRQAQPKLAYGILKELVDREKGNSSCLTLMRYYQVCYLMYKAKEPAFTNDFMRDEYFRVKEYLDTYKGAHPEDVNCTVAEEQIDKYGAPFLTCEELYKYATTKYTSVPKEDKANRLAQMKKLLATMNKKNCNDNDIYEKIAIEVDAAEPSHESAYNLGNVFMGKKKYADAITYYKKAAELCGECDKQGEYLMGVARANLNSGNSSGAASFARQAMAKDSKLTGQAYFLIGKAVVNSGCGANDFEKKFLYILGVEYMQKAKNADPALNNDANSLIGGWKARYPTKTELFERGLLDKETFLIGCWINESVPIPK